MTAEEIRVENGWYSAEYFNRARQIVEEEFPELVVTMQVFQKNTAILAGMSHVLPLFAGMDLEIEALPDGTAIQPFEPVMTITGTYAQFAHLESIYLGILARATKVATNARKAVAAAGGKPVLCFADRFDFYLNQPLDGYAAKIGGINSFATNAMCDGEGMGTMPHALIAACGGDLVKACELFRKHFPEVPLVALVDFNNDSVMDSLKVLKRFGKDLYAVRLDTSEKMIDESLRGYNGEVSGVNPQLVWMVRDELDQHGGKHVKIIVSGGFSPEKITKFESELVPVDIYAVGSGLLKGSNDFTADIVRPIAKQGRGVWDDGRLEPVNV